MGWGGRRGDGDCGVGGGCFVWVIGLYGWLGCMSGSLDCTDVIGVCGWLERVDGWDAQML